MRRLTVSLLILLLILCLGVPPAQVQGQSNWVEDINARAARVKVFYNTANPAQRRSVITAYDQHYWTGVNWVDTNETITDDATPGFTQKVDQLAHIIHLDQNGKRRWIPRRDFPNQYVEFGRLQYFNGTAWLDVPLGTPTRADNKIAWSTANFDLTVSVTWRQVKILVILKTPAAVRPIRWQVSLNGLTWNNWGLYSGSSLVGTVDRPVAWDANGSADNPNVVINTSYSGGYAQFSGDLSGAILPVTIDPTLTSQPDETAGLDTKIDAGAPTTNYGTLNTFNVGFKTSSARRTLIKFDFSSIPPGSFINSANLTLYQNSGSNTQEVDIYRLKHAWVESEATWNIYSTGNNWSTAGAFGSDDCEQTYIGSLSVDATAGEKTWSLTPSAIQEMITGGGFTNDGFLLMSTNETTDFKQFYTSDETTFTDRRPKIVVDYTEPTPTPTITLTPTATATATATDTPTPTASATATATDTPTPTYTVTTTPLPTDTPTPTVTLTPTETLTPTPTSTLPAICLTYAPDGYCVQLSSGNVMVVERRVTFGEIAIVIGILSVTIILGLMLMIRIFKSERSNL